MEWVNHLQQTTDLELCTLHVHPVGHLILATLLAQPRSSG